MHIFTLSAQSGIRMLVMLCRYALFTSNRFITFSARRRWLLDLTLCTTGVYAGPVLTLHYCQKWTCDQIDLSCYW